MAQQLERGSSLYIVAAALAVLHHSRPQNIVQAQLPWTEPQFNQFFKTNHAVQASRAITMVHKHRTARKSCGAKRTEKREARKDPNCPPPYTASYHHSLPVLDHPSSPNNTHPAPSLVATFISPEEKTLQL